MGQDVASNQALDDLTLQRDLDDGDDRDPNAVWEDERYVIDVAGMGGRGWRAYIGHSARGQLELPDDLRLDRRPRSSGVDQGCDLYRGRDGFALLSQQICSWLRDANAHLADRPRVAKIRKLAGKGRH